MVCGTRLDYDIGLMEVLSQVEPETCNLVRRLTKPPDRLYIRVNTSRINVDDYIKIAKNSGYTLERDEEIPEAVWAPVEGPHEIDDRGRRVVVDKRAAEAVMMGSNLYAPGVLYAEGVDRGDKVVIVDPNGIPVASGIAVMSWTEIKSSRRGLAVKVEESLYKSVRVSELPGYSEGLIYGQSLPSMYVARILDPAPGEVIVDMNAAPGGKMSHIAQLIHGEGKIIAIDRPSKVETLRRTVKRLRLSNVEIIGGDSRILSKTYPSLVGKVDAVVIDPPCTNLGVIPKIRDRKTLRDSVTLARYQRGFIREAFKLLKEGGRLIYSTCTLTPIENEANIAYGLEHGFAEAGLPGWVKRGYKSRLGLRFHPNRHGTPGFFIGLVLFKLRV
ncbi:MAG: RsmB/NOP family class I SAM-dependent RNA methyltransferase [Desulfurococcales archaeon]|nr:RsmB/NOP family class I SAM-dependent RNA methyltransferase [Desulfurococcales archaeon]